MSEKKRPDFAAWRAERKRQGGQVSPEPRYDEVFFRGLEELESAGMDDRQPMRVRFGARLRLDGGAGAVALTRDEARAAILALETALREGR